MQDYHLKLDKGVDKVRQLSRQFCETLGLTMFAYVRVYHDGRTGWVTSDSDHDHLLLESESIDKDPLIDTAQALKQGYYLWFHNRTFPGSEQFYRDRSRLFHLDHGMVVVTHQKDYLETCCFSGLLAKRPLYNLFMNELGLFKAFKEHFKQQLTPSLLHIIDEGVPLSFLKSSYGIPPDNNMDEQRSQILTSCGWNNLLRLSKREKECLALLREGHTYQGIAKHLHLSPRTVEQYVGSVKIKLGLESHGQLFQAAHKLAEMGLINRK
ncbi:MAG: helix-turn-helix transcriptional regulator [Parachlamydia sp.]|nr:helix-turn-helix transcriptional regulator [Parachlamydia sp.]